ncbi:putative quinol monooxygenase [Nocardia tengchongensis]
MAIQLTAILNIIPSRTADFESALTALAKDAATEPGVLDYGFWRDPSHAGRYLLRELYADQTAVDTHMARPAVAAFVADLPNWLAGDTHADLESTAALTRIPLSRSVMVSSLDGGRHA